MQQSRPRTYKVHLRNLVLLPYRICNPPPAVGKVRSCSVTPIYQIQLDDVLESRHLPPLGLKDFEEWLLYVEDSPENLYFVLWFKQYAQQHREWANGRFESEGEKFNRISQLDWFYLRAKQTFFTPNAEFELNLPSHILAPFHSSNPCSHPEPELFDSVVEETKKQLQESLQHFLTAQYNNVGNNRVLCGIIAGVFFTLLGGVLPLIYNTLAAHSRWLRLTALPGMWMGLLVLLSALNGVCVGVYVFGDLRQLHKFELTRPPISKPQPLPEHYQSPIEVMGPVIMPPTPPPVHLPCPSSSSIASSRSFCSSSNSDDSSVYSSHEGHRVNMIQISPAYYDAEPVEGPATGNPARAIANYDRKCSMVSADGACDSSVAFARTATFIRPYVPDLTSDSEDESAADEKKKNRTISPTSPTSHVGTFNFDQLPMRRRLLGPEPQYRAAHTDGSFYIEPPEVAAMPSGVSYKALIARFQRWCVAPNKWLVMSGGKGGADADTMSPSWLERGEKSCRQQEPPVMAHHWKSKAFQKRLSFIQAVPAFGSPLTKIHSPIVVRGQWEIVMKSTIIALFISWIIVGVLLAVPVRT
ncbi:hypothetical protein FISHEDRAFT_49164 [Fistulina hepatica ATCC 64428]|uniref:RGS domain-containing protein n=1 Tax=Fistulina hepatica ATCC 64428 TaxID=1128425 RepID=A0A0D7A4E1_9AGAR|nr:hypothetical protein FISHEDRAFT_49164 [Fistulina hepatica ATCC 64428]